ncbi:hypothetical protein [Promicromonospora sp. NFX87]|uniref:hypothetical protein n=1 Tax=Promicromonospora sp. NFX87 TaxID=3402691 RepID=UPI003AFA114E
MAAHFFEPSLQALRLTFEDVASFSLEECEEALARIDDAMGHPEQFGTLRLKFDVTSSWVVARANIDAHVEQIGILPLLLKQKAAVLDRIRDLRPVDQLNRVRDDIARIVSPGTTKDALLQALRDHAEEEQKESERIARASSEVEQELLEHRVTGAFEARITSAELRLDQARKDIDRVEAKALNKWDVVTVVFAVAVPMIAAAALVVSLIK